jgi:arylsulfatase A-like enzyme
VVLFLVDDAGVECFGPYGGEYPTPHLDRLAAEGVRFENAHSQPLCTPSRVKLMTGQSNLRNYVRFSVLDPDEWTFGHLMRDAGYATGIVGKWQLLAGEHYGDLAGMGMHPRDSGFDEYLLWQVEALGSRYWGPVLDRDGELTEDAESEYGPDLFADWAVDFVALHRDEPFFLYYPMALVHDPFDSPPGTEWREGRERLKNFGPMITYADTLLGRVLDALESHGLRENTLVIFTSDNGTHPSIFSTRDGVRVQGGKGKTTDAATHVPLVASLRGTTPAGSSCPDLIDFADFVPTLAELAGAELSPERPCDGVSFLSQVLGRRGTPREVLFCYSNPRPDERPEWERRWARDHRYKLYGDGELYDLDADPLEQQPLPVEGTEELRTRLRAAIDAMPAQPAKLRRKDASGTLSGQTQKEKP